MNTNTDIITPVDQTPCIGSVITEAQNVSGQDKSSVPKRLSDQARAELEALIDSILAGVLESFKQQMSTKLDKDDYAIIGEQLLQMLRRSMAKKKMHVEVNKPTKGGS